MVQPVILTGTPPYTIVTGFRRIEAALQLGWSDIPCFLEEIGDREALLHAIHDNLSRGLNIVEKGMALEKMVRKGFATSEVFATMHLLDLSPHEKVLHLLATLASSEDALKTFVVTREVSLRNIEYLLRFDGKGQRDIIGILSPFHVTESLLREVLQFINLLKVRGTLPAFDDLANLRDIDELRRKLKGVANPRLSAMELELADLKQKCALPPGLDIRVDPFFEKEYIDISIRARAPEDLKQAVDKLESILEASYIRSILGLTKG